MSLINAASLGLSASPSFASDPSGALYAFGDSLSDAGNVFTLTAGKIPVSPPYSDGRFTNGAVWVQDLAASLNLPAVTPSLRGGTDFAYGDAQTGTTPQHAGTAIDLPSQLAQFKFANHNPQADALYTLSIGSNDVLDSISVFPTNPAAAMNNIAAAAANETQFIVNLIGNGARNLAVLNVPDIGGTPRATSSAPGTTQVASYLSALYDQQLNTALQPLTGFFNLHVVNAFALLDGAIANPALFGLTNVTDPVWTGNYTDPSSGTVRATGAAADTFLFFDSLHPTAHGHAVVSSFAQASIA